MNDVKIPRRTLNMSAGDRWFESCSLQQRVTYEPENEINSAASAATVFSFENAAIATPLEFRAVLLPLYAFESISLHRRVCELSVPLEMRDRTGYIGPEHFSGAPPQRVVKLADLIISNDPDDGAPPGHGVRTA
jgi:hypothetical protein